MEAGSNGNSPSAWNEETQAADENSVPVGNLGEDLYSGGPTEASRLQMSEQLGLTDRQLKMCFCHRRLKDKKRGTPAGNTELLERSRKNLMVADHGSDRDKNLKN